MHFRPVMDRILLRKIKQPEVVNGVVIPDKYKESNEYEVVALGDFAVLGGQRFPLTEFAAVGDTVLVGQYNLERVDVEGEELWLTRIQDVRGRRAARTRAPRAMSA